MEDSLKVIIFSVILTTRIVVIKISHLNKESSNTMGLRFSMGEQAGQALLQPLILLPAVTFKLLYDSDSNEVHL